MVKLDAFMDGILSVVAIVVVDPSVGAGVDAGEEGDAVTVGAGVDAGEEGDAVTVYVQSDDTETVPLNEAPATRTVTMPFAGTVYVFEKIFV